MDEFLLDTLHSVSSEYATGTGEFFVLDRLERYPGKLPFAPATAPQPNETDATSPQEPAPVLLQLDPAFAAEIAAEVERSRMRRAAPSEDPLARLAEQLEAFELTRAERTEPIGAEQSLPGPTATQTSTHPGDEFAEEHATEDHAAGSTAPHQPQHRRTTVLVAIGMLVAIVASVVLFRQQWLNHLISSSTSDTTRASTSSASPTAPALNPQMESQQQESASSGEQRNSTTVTDTPAAQTQRDSIEAPIAKAAPISRATSTASSSGPHRTPVASAKSAEDRPNDVAIIEPPTLPPPKSDGTFVIQLCSTPSYSDALRWKRYAEERASGKQVTITERTIRQQTYYRVRVGVYGSLVEAEQAARSLGLSLADVWIVQIK
ncbi:MAG: hypothetical protein KatS3mg040_0842 [Candidatus Kapaibacterium sp.]|nr:MAG: hypothetical protein KatS3mg040_0842 [Candidatus Kapabacteria bacterium]